MKTRLNFYLSLPLIILSISSCTKFQYISVSPHNTQGLVVADNDTVKIEYKFNGLNGPINVSVHNKQNQPLYVDWEKSALIIDGERFSYYTTNDEINLTSNDSEIRWNETISTSSGTASGSIKRDAAMSFVPPNSFVTKRTLALRSNFISYPKKQFERKNIVSIDGRIVPVRVIQFTPESTPIKFRSYLTISLNNQALTRDDSFWVTEIMETLAEPKTLPSNTNQFYVLNSTGFGQVIGITGLISVLTFAVIAAE